MQIHFGPNPADVLDKGETVAAMKDAVKEGKVKYLGASIDGELATRCIKSGDFDVMQMAYNLINQANEENIKLAAENGIGVFIRSGLGKGIFTPRVLEHMDNLNTHEQTRMKKLLELVDNDLNMLTSLALNFLYANKNISSILLGTKKPAHIKANIELLEKDVSGDLLAQAQKIVNEV
jgi:aryl-alcohol dehydrogenase-like predicted oxidoreductase